MLYIRGIIFGIGMNGDWRLEQDGYGLSHILGILDVIEQVLICDDF